MKAAIYTRVSSDEQATSGHSLTSQEDLCRRYAESNGLEVVAVYSDALSGANLDRPQLQSMLLAVEAGEVEAIVCHANDRLTRDTMHLGLILERLLKADCRLHFATTGAFDPENPENRMMLGIQGEFAAYWREKIRMGARLGKRRRALRGKVPLNGVAPYGYRIEDGHLIIVETEAEIVRRIFHEYTDTASPSLEKVARTLRGTKSPTEAGHGPAGLTKIRRVGPGVWSTAMIRRILTLPTYSGTWVYGKSRTRYDGERVKSSDTVLIDCPPIVSTATQQKAMERLVENRRRRDGRAKLRNYLLSGHMKCGSCGLSYTGMTSGKKVMYAYYRCSGRQSKLSLDGEHPRCINTAIRAEYVEQQARMFLIALYTDPEYTRQMVERWQEEKLSESPAVERIATIDGKLAGLTSKRARLLVALDGVKDDAGARGIGDMLAALGDDEARLKTERHSLSSSPSSVRFQTKDMAELAEAAIRGKIAGDGIWYGPPEVQEDGSVQGQIGYAYLQEIDPETDKVKDGGEILDYRLPEELTGAFEFTRQRMRESEFKAVVLPNGTVDFSARIPGENTPTKVQSNVPGYKTTVDAVKYHAMHRALQKVLPNRGPGLTQAEMVRAVVAHLPQDLFPDGAKAGWWMKTVQLDQEAKGSIVREPGKPLRWHRTTGG